MCKTLIGTIAMNGFTFIPIAIVVSCQVDKVLVLTKLGFKVV
jgi:hypothetical protein